MPGLQLIEEFLNTVDERTFRRHGNAHEAGETLTSPPALKAWLNGHDLPVAEVGEADVSAAVALRTTLREGGAVPHPLRLEVGGRSALTADTGRPWLDVLVVTVAESVARGDWGRMKLCAAPDCRWAFHDTSRNGRGRWCSMEVCGNRTKTRTYRDRHRSFTSM